MALRLHEYIVCLSVKVPYPSHVRGRCHKRIVDTLTCFLLNRISSDIDFHDHSVRASNHSPFIARLVVEDINETAREDTNAENVLNSDPLPKLISYFLRSVVNVRILMRTNHARRVHCNSRLSVFPRSALDLDARSGVTRGRG